MITGIFIIFSLYAIVIAIAELLFVGGISSHVTRKFSHIGAGIVSATLPFFVSLNISIVIGILFFALFFYSKKNNLFPSIYGGRDDHGAAYFPLGLVICAILFWNINSIIFSMAIFLFAIADGVAGLVGEKYGKNEYNFMGKKTIEGSVAFFVASFAILVAGVYLFPVGISVLPVFVFIPLSAIFLSIAEGLFGKGLDNLVLPSLAGFIFAVLL